MKEVDKMKKKKICVYAICKNEEQFVDRWYNSVKEADQIYVLDTGSTDQTVEKLEALGVIVKQEKIDPWRFDVARNKSLEMIPLDVDICVSIDLDEIFHPGWRKELDKVWKKNTTRCKYIYNWSLDEENKPLITFYYEKIHSRKNFKWVYPVHEVLKCDIEEQYVITDNIILDHYPDSNKSRSSYLPLLELATKENPDNDRNMHYLGREYMYYKKWNECIDTLIAHLNLPTATWKDERCASMRFIAKSYQHLNRYEEARMWLKKAIMEAPHLREPYIDLAFLEYRSENWSNVIWYILEALKIEEHPKTYINEPSSFDSTPYDLLSIAYYHNKDLKNALIYVDKALALDPTNERLLANKELILKAH